MTFPYQRVEACNRTRGDSHEWILFAASGPKLVVQSSGGASSVWPAAENVEVKVRVYGHSKKLALETGVLELRFVKGKRLRRIG